MTQRQNGSARVVIPITLLVIAGIIAAIAWALHRNKPTIVSVKMEPPTSQPVKVETPPTRPGAPPEQPKELTYLDVLRSNYPEFPATQPLGFPLDLKQAAHFLVKEPVYLSSPPRVDLWITRADAPPTDQVLEDAVDPEKDSQIHLTRERIAFVHWIPTDSGPWRPCLICPTSDDGFEAVTATQRRALPRRDYRWQHALSWYDKLVVPCSTGVSVLSLGPTIVEHYHELAPTNTVSPGANLSEPQILLDWKGLLVWLPWESGKSGGHGAARYVDDSWKDLGPDAGFPEKILHLIPLNDGNVLIIGVADTGGAQLSMAVLDRVEVDEKKIAALVESLADPDESKRQVAYKQLTTFGSGIWPILEKMMNEQEPEAQLRLRLLLKDKVEPSLGGMKLLGDKVLRLAARLDDGGSVFYAEEGVNIPNPDPDADPTIVAPAWLSIRPGMPIELLPPAMITDLKPGVAKIYAVGADWLVNSDVRGPRRFVGNTLVNLLRKSEYPYSELLGEDRRGRWLLRRPAAAATQPSTLPAAEANATLIIDPTLPDPTPRLPVWVFKNAKTVGWDKDNWPVVKDISAYALHEDSWRLLDENEPMYTRPQDIPGSPVTQPGTTLPATQSATTLPTTQSATTLPATEPTPLLVDTNGNRYYDGLTELRVVSAKGEVTNWSLPAIANGEGPATLLRTQDGHLFLFNQRGRVLRIKPTPGESEPYHLDAIFTRNIPTLDGPTRIWLDPAQRIVITQGNQLTFLFTGGYVPPAIAEKMTHEPDPDE